MVLAAWKRRLERNAADIRAMRRHALRNMKRAPKLKVRQVGRLDLKNGERSRDEG